MTTKASIVFFYLVYRCIPLEVWKGEGSISAIYNWFEKIIYLCTDLNPDQYKQYS